MLSSKPTKAIGLDIGSHSVKAVQISKSGDTLRVEHVGYAAIDPAQMTTDPIEAQGAAVLSALEGFATKNAVFVGALPGQTVVIRYPRLPDMPDEQLRQAIEREAAQNLPFELSEVFLDFVVLDRGLENEEQVAKVLLVAAKHELIDSCIRVAEAAGVQYAILTVDALALADAAESCGFLGANETVSLIDIGATSTIVHFVKDGVSNYYRDVNWGTKELVQAICRANRCEPPIAEQILKEWGKRNPAETGSGEFVTEQHEAVAPPELEPLATEEPPEFSLDGELGDLGGSPLEPLQEEKTKASQKDLRKSSAFESSASQEGEQVIRIPLSNFVNEIRRSFDFYEHQMYERPVERVLVSGGVSAAPFIKERLRQELGLDQIEIANPASSRLVLGRTEDVAPLLKQPAQFMVAVGLAARGAAEI